jgi:moderate conductance mechanosensitive channel
MKWWTMMERTQQTLLALGQRSVTWIATSGLRIALIVFMAAIAARVLKSLSSHLRKILAGDAPDIEREKRADTVAGIVRTIGGILILVGTVMMVLNEIGVNIGPFVATAGIGGLAFGFGAQTLVRDVITGFFLLLEDEIRIGDVVKIADKEGLVERISLRTIRVRDVDGTVHVVPNSSVTTVSNMTLGFSRYVVDIPIAENADLKSAFAALDRVAKDIESNPELAKDVVEPLEVLGLDSPTKLPVVKARITTKPRRQWDVGREVNFLIRTRFAESGVELR